MAHKSQDGKVTSEILSRSENTEVIVPGTGEKYDESLSSTCWINYIEKAKVIKSTSKCKKGLFKIGVRNSNFYFFLTAYIMLSRITVLSHRSNFILKNGQINFASQKRLQKDLSCGFGLP